MHLIIRTFSIIAILCLASCVQTVEPEVQSPKMIVLTDTLNKDSSLLNAKWANDEDRQRYIDSREKRKAEREAARDLRRNSSLKSVAQSRKEMQMNGFIVRHESYCTSAVPAQVIDHQKENNDSYASLSGKFGYNAINLEKTLFRSGKLIGVMPGWPEDDDRIHEMTYLYEFEEFGTVILQELSFGTIPNIKLSIVEPAGNIFINGHPGEFTVAVSESGEKAMTSIFFITDEKTFGLTALSKILKDSEDYDRFVQLAEELH